MQMPVLSTMDSQINVRLPTDSKNNLQILRTWIMKNKNFSFLHFQESSQFVCKSDSSFARYLLLCCIDILLEDMSNSIIISEMTSLLERKNSLREIKDWFKANHPQKVYLYDSLIAIAFHSIKRQNNSEYNVPDVYLRNRLLEANHMSIAEYNETLDELKTIQ